MSKIIKLTSEHIEECVKEFREDLASSKVADGKINYTKNLSAISRKAKIFFSECAWLKMQALIKEFDKEVAWHGVAFRGDDETKDEYIIKDILVYPQQVTGASVEMNTEDYAKWIEKNIDDERFFNIRMQGHSHVTMGVTPSSVDLTHQEAILDQLSENMFYIFMIWNKKQEKNIKIYDMKKNILFESTDIDVDVLDDGYGIDSFIADAKTKVKDRVYTGYRYPEYGTTGYKYKTPSYTSYSSTEATPYQPIYSTAKTNNTNNAKKTEFGSAKRERRGKRKGKKNKAQYSKEQFVRNEYGYYDC